MIHYLNAIRDLAARLASTSRILVPLIFVKSADRQTWILQCSVRTERVPPLNILRKLAIAIKLDDYDRLL